MTYRSSLARLAKELIREGQGLKAEKIIDLALQNMPVDYYGYYFLYESFISGFFRIGREEKAMILWEKVVAKYQENLIYYSS